MSTNNRHPKLKLGSFDATDWFGGAFDKLWLRLPYAAGDGSRAIQGRYAPVLVRIPVNAVRKTELVGQSVRAVKALRER